MSRLWTSLICLLWLASAPVRAEFQQIDLRIYGMD
jgi:hypothetical protein